MDASSSEAIPLPPDFSILGPHFEVDPEPIGIGAFGSVHFGLMLLGARQKAVAVKSIDKVRTRTQAEAGGARTDSAKLIQCEVDITAELGKTKHRNMPRFYGKWEDENHVHIVLQLCEGGELSGWLMEQKAAYSERMAARIIYDSLQAVLCCHDLGIVHRDVKPQNLLFTTDAEDARLLLVDFGLAARMEIGGEPLTEMCGTLDYMAPEMLRGAYDERVDVWAIGVLLHLLLTGAHPFRGPSQGATQQRILASELDTSSPLYHDVSPDALDLLRLLLSPQPSLRPTARQALKHSWLRRRNDQSAPLLPERIPGQLMAVCQQENWWMGSHASMDGRSVDGDSSPSFLRSPSPMRIFDRGDTNQSIFKSLSLSKFSLPGALSTASLHSKGRGWHGPRADSSSDGDALGAAVGKPVEAEADAGSPREALASLDAAQVCLATAGPNSRENESLDDTPLQMKRISSAAEKQLEWLKQQEVEFEEADEVEAADEADRRLSASARLIGLLSTIQQRKVEVYYKQKVFGRFMLPRWRTAMLSHYSDDEALFLTIGSGPCRKLIEQGGTRTPSMRPEAPPSGAAPINPSGSTPHGRGSLLSFARRTYSTAESPDVRLPIDKIEEVSRISDKQLRLQHAGEKYRLRLRDASAADEIALALQARMDSYGRSPRMHHRSSSPPRHRAMDRSSASSREEPTATAVPSLHNHVAPYRPVLIVDANRVLRHGEGVSEDVPAPNEPPDGSCRRSSALTRESISFAVDLRRDEAIVSAEASGAIAAAAAADLVRKAVRLAISKLLIEQADSEQSARSRTSGSLRVRRSSSTKGGFFRHLASGLASAGSSGDRFSTSKPPLDGAQPAMGVPVSDPAVRASDPLAEFVPPAVSVLSEASFSRVSHLGATSEEERSHRAEKTSRIFDELARRDSSRGSSTTSPLRLPSPPSVHLRPHRHTPPEFSLPSSLKSNSPSNISIKSPDKKAAKSPYNSPEKKGREPPVADVPTVLASPSKLAKPGQSSRGEAFLKLTPPFFLRRAQLRSAKKKQTYTAAVPKSPMKEPHLANAARPSPTSGAPTNMLHVLTTETSPSSMRVPSPSITHQARDRSPLKHPLQPSPSPDPRQPSPSTYPRLPSPSTFARQPSPSKPPPPPTPPPPPPTPPPPLRRPPPSFPPPTAIHIEATRHALLA